MRRFTTDEDVREFLGTDEKPVSRDEFAEFWATLTAEEQLGYVYTSQPRIRPRRNTYSNMARYLGCTMHEFYSVWYTLTEAEKAQFFFADLT